MNFSFAPLYRFLLSVLFTMNYSSFIRMSCLGALFCLASSHAASPTVPTHTFAIRDKDFLLDGKPFQIRCGEMHLARIPREYWRHRLQLMKAMGLNSVCAYLFWNFHEWERGHYQWAGEADAAEFCRIAQEEGLWVVLRPGPYACAEWDGGGLPWWLLKSEKIELRTRDPEFLTASLEWLKEVGRVLAPLQVTHGGPILLVQAENEYGSYGKDADYMGRVRQGLIDAGFDVPLFACNPAGDLRNGWREDLFEVVNFGRDPEAGFKALRDVQPAGPLMCGEFYPGWFDTWGAPHHTGDTGRYLADLDTMLKEGASFSIYMAHGGTSFGMWAGADRPFKPDTSSYDYDAPISEAGWIGEKFRLTRELIEKHLQPGEKLPAPPAPLPVMSVPEFTLRQAAPLFENLPKPVPDTAPHFMESYDQGRGCIIYRTSLPAGPAATLKVDQAHDMAWVFVDGKQVGVMDRRSRRFSVRVPARSAPARLDILVEAMGHVNFGREVHDRKGLLGPVRLGADELSGEWRIFRFGLDADQLAGLQWKENGAVKGGPAFWSGSFEVKKTADTFLDLSQWGKGMVWVNGRCLARFWDIGPTQTAYLPGAWLHPGRNEIVILDLVGPRQPVLAGLEKPILNQLRPELDFATQAGSKGTLKLADTARVHSGEFEPGPDAQEVRFKKPVTGSQFCIEALDAHDDKPFAAIAELDVLGADGRPLSHVNWTVAYVDSEESVSEDGSATNAIDGQTASYWLTAMSQPQPGCPHRLVLDLGEPVSVTGFRYVPRPGGNVTGRIKNYQIYVSDPLVVPTP
jgi:beta-galactosidase